MFIYVKIHIRASKEIPVSAQNFLHIFHMQLASSTIIVKWAVAWPQGLCGDGKKKNQVLSETLWGHTDVHVCPRVRAKSRGAVSPDPAAHASLLEARFKNALRRCFYNEL